MYYVKQNHFVGKNRQIKKRVILIDIIKENENHILIKLLILLNYHKAFKKDT